jgi:transcriptional regulator with XRE-family HTH domain
MKKEIMKNYFGQTLKEFRVKAKLTQGQVAKKMDITQQQFSAYETGKNNPDLSTIILICVILKVNPLELIEQSLNKSKYFKDMPDDEEHIAFLKKSLK